MTIISKKPTRFSKRLAVSIRPFFFSIPTLLPRVKKVLSFSTKSALSLGKNFAAGILWGLFASTAIAQDAERDITTDERGMHNGFYYDFWKTPSQANVTFGLREAGRFTAEWNGAREWIGGIGWKPGSRDKVLKYSGTFNLRLHSSSRNSYLALFGSARKPHTEFYVVESYGNYNPASCPLDRKTYGSYQSDGATYDISTCRRDNWGIAPPTALIFSVRNPKKNWGDVSGTITVANHFDAWESKGLIFDDLDYMIFTAEGLDLNGNASGNADISITDAAVPLNCGEASGVPVCCDIGADPDGDGMGIQNIDQVCIVTEKTKGWHPANPADVLAAINVGGRGHAVVAGDIYYSANNYSTGGKDYLVAEAEVSGSGGSAVYQSALQGVFTFDIPVNEQRVSVELGFVEFEYNQAGSRLFNVAIEGETVLTDLDIYEKAGYRVLWKPAPFETNVTDGKLTIAVTSDSGIGVLSSILVRKASGSSSSSSNSSSSSSSSSSNSSSSSSSSTSSSSSSSSGSSGAGGGSTGWWILVMIGSLLAFPQPSFRPRRYTL